MNPYLLLGGVAAILAISTGAFFIGDSHGADRVIAREAKAAAKAEVLATTLAAERQSTRDAVDTAGTERAALIAALASKGRDTVKEYYRANPVADRPCLAVDRVRSIAAADAAATAAVAPGDRADRVPHPAAAAPRADGG